MLFRPTLAIGAAALLAGCGGQAGNQAAPETNETNIIELPSLPVPAPPMDREALIMAAIEAASAAAAGIDDSDAQRMLDGNRFELRIRFGCGGPAAAEEQRVMSWRFDPKERTLRLRAAPNVDKQDPVVAAIAGDAFEAVEGFWVPRPWLLQPSCPAKPAPAAAAQPADGKTAQPAKPAPAKTTAAQKPPVEPGAAEEAPAAPAAPVHLLGIAQFFSPTDSRIGRRDGQPYEATKLLDQGIAPSAEGYNLVLSGRLDRLPNGRAIACKPGGMERPPQCLISADFDRVWIEHPGSKQVIAEWRSGG